MDVIEQINEAYDRMMRCYAAWGRDCTAELYEHYIIATADFNRLVKYNWKDIHEALWRLEDLEK